MVRVVTTLREQQLADTFVSLTDALAESFDPPELMAMLAERTAELLDVSAVGVILVDGAGNLLVAAASSERSRLLEVFAVAIDVGPCVDCVRSGEPVTCEDIRDHADRWPRFAAGASEAGFRAFHALPIRLREKVVGVLTLLNVEPHTLAGEDRRLGQALANAAAIGIIQQQAIRQAETVAAQLQHALDSRVVIEQAKGILANRANVPPEDAFVFLRGHARSRGLRLSDVAASVVAGTVDLSAVIPPPA